MSAMIDVEGGWVPAVKLDLYNATPYAFAEIESQFRKWASGQTLPPLDAVTGWMEVTPQRAEAWLMRNAQNRKTNFATIEAYSQQMINDQWKRTGQTITFSAKEMLVDGQHRLWAALLSGCTFNCYVITDLPHEKNIFAFIDNVRPRSAADALQTAGVNGKSSQVAKIVKELAWPWDREALLIRGRVPMVAMMNHEVLSYQQEHLELLTAVKLVYANYKAAAGKLGTTVAGFVAWKILELYDETILEGFMTAVGGDSAALPPGHPVAALLKILAEHEAAKAAKAYGKVGKLSKMRMRQINALLTMTEVLAYTIKAFNLMQIGARVQKLAFDRAEAMPQFVTPEELAEHNESELPDVAAEAA